jgi:hypothetical protein
VKRILFAALLIACARPVLAQASKTSLKGLPPGPRPVQVAIGAYLIDLEKIDESTLTHTIDGYLTLEWNDPRLSRAAAPDLDRSAMTLEEIWSPNIEFVNQHAEPDLVNSELVVRDDGHVRYDERFKVDLSTDFDLRRFPFDEQTMVLSIESFSHDRSEVQFTARQPKELRSPDAFLPDWDITGVDQRLDTDAHDPDQVTYARYNFAIHVHRKRGFYYWNTFLPLAFITLLAWAVFFVPADDLQTRTGVSITALLTAIAFSLVISGTRPRVSYLTFMDAVFLNAYFLIFVAIVAVIGAHFSTRPPGDDKSVDAGGERLSALWRWMFPLLGVVTYGALALKFLL